MSTPDPLAVLTPGTHVFATDAFGDDLSGVITRGPWRGNRTEFLKVTVRFDPDARDHRGIGGGATVPWPVEFVRPVASTTTKGRGGT